MELNEEIHMGYPRKISRVLYLLTKYSNILYIYIYSLAMNFLP